MSPPMLRFAVIWALASFQSVSQQHPPLRRCCNLSAYSWLATPIMMLGDVTHLKLFWFLLHLCKEILHRTYHSFTSSSHMFSSERAELLCYWLVVFLDCLSAIFHCHFPQIVISSVEVGYVSARSAGLFFTGTNRQPLTLLVSPISPIMWATKTLNRFGDRCDKMHKMCWLTKITFLHVPDCGFLLWR